MALAPLAQAQSSSKRKRTTAKRRRYPLSPGQHYWMPQIAPKGPVVAVVNLHTQMVQVFRNGVAIGFSSSSTGKPGYGTPPGVFTVLEKRRHHRSSTYDNAPMPWMVRLTWSGVAFHVGRLPGYPASHGCIRLPNGFAPKLFSTISRGDTVWITNTSVSDDTSPMTMLAPIAPNGQSLLTAAAIEQAEYWSPTPEGTAPEAMPVNILASLSQRRVYVLQQGQLLAAAEIPAGADDIPQMEGGALFTWQIPPAAEPASAPASSSQWQAIDANATRHGDALVQHVLPATSAFVQRLQGLLTPGSLLFVSHLPAVNDVHWVMVRQQEKQQIKQQQQQQQQSAVPERFLL